MADLLDRAILPGGWSYPPEFVEFAKASPRNLEPWFVLKGKRLRDRYDDLRRRYPDRQLVPFARRQDNDDVAAWEGAAGGRVTIVHDFAEPGWEQREWLPTFTDWLHRAERDHEDWIALS